MDQIVAERVVEAVRKHKGKLKAIEKKRSERKSYKTNKLIVAEGKRYLRELSHIVGSPVTDDDRCVREARRALGTRPKRSRFRDVGKVASSHGLARGREWTGGNTTVYGGLPGSKR